MSRSRSVACVPAATALAPNPTSIGVLGITRMTRAPFGSNASNRAAETPAQIDASTCRSVLNAGAIWLTTVLTICGLTHSTTISPDAKTARLSSVARAPR